MVIRVKNISSNYLIYQPNYSPTYTPKCPTPAGEADGFSAVEDIPFN
jgi:hypothetical protein